MGGGEEVVLQSTREAEFIEEWSCIGGGKKHTNARLQRSVPWRMDVECNEMQ